MQKLVRMFVLFGLTAYACKSTRTSQPPSPNEVVTAPAADPPPKAEESQPETSAETQPTSPATPTPATPSICDQNPDDYHRVNGECVAIPNVPVEGTLLITSGVIWQASTRHCNKWATGTFRFCMGASVSIPIAKPAQGTGKTRVSLRFNCNAVGGDSGVKLKLRETAALLRSASNDDFIFTHDLTIAATEDVNMTLVFAANYNATYPANCKLELVDNRLLPIN